MKPLSICRNPYLNSKTHVQIMNFTCRLNMGLADVIGQRDVTSLFRRNEMVDVEEAVRFSVSIDVVNILTGKSLVSENTCKIPLGHYTFKFRIEISSTSHKTVNETNISKKNN